MNDVLSRGWTVDVDDDGRLGSAVSTAPIGAPFDALCDAAIDRVVRRCGPSVVAVYLRGSVARGTAVVGASDCDVVVVVDEAVSAAERASIDRPLSIGGVRLDLAVLPANGLLEGGRYQSVGALLSLEGRCVAGRPVATAPAVLDRTVDPSGRLEEVVHRIVVHHERWSIDRLAWRVLRAAAQVVARETRRYALDLEPTVREVVGGPSGLGRGDVERLAAAVRGQGVEELGWVLDIAFELVDRQEVGR